MDLEWSEEQVAFRATTVDFARKELNDQLMSRDEHGEFARDAWKKCADFGVQGWPFPEEYGGQGADTLTTLLGMEALGYGCRDNGLLFSLNAHMWSGAMPILRFGSDEQRHRYLPGMIDGTLIGVQGMTEPSSGSDAFSLKTKAERRGDSYVLDGSKIFITNAPVADLFVVFATTNPALGSFGISAFIIEKDAPGLTVGAPFKKMGLRTSPMSELFFDACEVPAENLLGKPGNGMAIFNHSIDWERACILASAIGTMERQVEDAVAYAKEREQFGRPIADFQAVSHRIVDMKTRLEAARWLLYRAGWAKSAGGMGSAEAAMAKLFISEAWVQTSLDLIQLHGGYGFMTETGVERELRDAIASRIYSGTSEIQKNIIARSLGL